MRRLAERKEAVAERLRREGSSRAAGLSATDAKLRLLELERDARKARAERSAPTKGLFKRACSTDLLFLIDTTGSMCSYIDAAKKQVLDIVNDIKHTFLNDVDVRIAAVSYKDYNSQRHLEAIDFTTSADEVRSFIGTLEASGGGDTPEDVLGAFQAALSLSWSQQTRCIIHIADAPGHGSTMHKCTDDDHPYPEDPPSGRTYDLLLADMIAKNINYTFLRITDLTDLMTYVFFQKYFAAGAEGTLHESNHYYSESKTSMLSGSCDSAITVRAKLLFTEEELGTTYNALRRLVVSSVTSSASRTAVRVSSLQSSKAWASRTPKTKLAMLSEEDDVAGEIELDTSPPEWNSPGWLDEKLIVEGFSPNIVVHGAGTLDDKMADDNNITMSVSELTIMKRSKPFAQGALRVASYARTASSDSRFVVKSFKRGGKRLAHLVEDMRCQALCKAFALEFNALSNEEKSIDFIATTCFKGKSDLDTDAADNCLSLEPYIQGTYVKYNNNCGWVNEAKSADRFNQVAQAFSHFTFERSQGRFLVCDLQGVGCNLTDPAIHTRDSERFKLTDSNLGEDGFKFFFSTHTCNDICQTLALKSNATMLHPGAVLTFRETWPSLRKTTCCSNKLCGKIIRVWLAHQSSEYTGYHWCSTCFPQLEKSKKKWLCLASDDEADEHEFDVSTFFWESQGRRAPRRCIEHRSEEERVLEQDNLIIEVERYGGEVGLVDSSPPSYVSSPGGDAGPSVPVSTGGSGTTIGRTATVRNSGSLWGRLKAATKVKRAGSRNLMGG
ncbi:hypothetical protein FB567DRAFT_436409 [Paraphoma chrysanthemicola]|uniref:Alpha-type protein kinase domain-containing protein n=1 Tax=Paraphoma chrysanthemicola TaxID=798071 RepID=A0A8K0RBT0_9PLEO|nr:hypothetical protein FB567DRAFT_436409 [Paraphoma chrysanthemicola]